MRGYGHECVQVESNLIMENNLDGLSMSVSETEYERVCMLVSLNMGASEQEREEGWRCEEEVEASD